MPDLPFIVILASEVAEIEAITRAVASLGCEHAGVASRRALEEMLRVRPCNGVVVGIPTLLKLDSGDKEFLLNLESGFPVARVRYTADGAIVAMSALTGVSPSLADFLGVCEVWQKRRIRNADRLKINLNVQVHGAGEAEATFTVDVSIRGCFLATARTWQVGDALRITVHEAASPLELVGTVRRVVPWGARFQAPGIGVQFEPLEPDARDLLLATLSGAS